MDTVTAIPLPDGRWDKRLYIEYVTMDETLASSSIINRGFVEVDGIKFSSADGGSSNAGYTLRILENPSESGTGLNHIFVDYNSTTHQITIETNGSANDFSRKDIVTAINNSAKEQGFVEVDGIRFSLKDPWPSKLNFSIELDENLTATLDDNVSVDLNLTTKHILIETNGTASDFSRKSIVDAINSSNSTNESVVASLVDENDTGKLSGTFNSIDLNWTAPVNKLVLASLVDTNDDGNLSGIFSGISLNFRPYSKPNGLSGFVELPYFEVASPEVHNPDALPAYRATAYGLFFIDHDETILLPLWMEEPVLMYPTLVLISLADGVNHSLFYNLWFAERDFNLLKKFHIITLMAVEIPLKLPRKIGMEPHGMMQISFHQLFMKGDLLVDIPQMILVKALVEIIGMVM